MQNLVMLITSLSTHMIQEQVTLEEKTTATSIYLEKRGCVNDFFTLFYFILFYL